MTKAGRKATIENAMTVSIRFSRDDWEALKYDAWVKRKSVSQVVRELVQEYLALNKKVEV